MNWPQPLYQAVIIHKDELFSSYRILEFLWELSNILIVIENNKLYILVIKREIMRYPPFSFVSKVTCFLNLQM